MLETVRNYIENLDDISFKLYFLNYIIKMQDVDLDNEFKYLTTHNSMSISKVDRLISSVYKGLVST